MPPQTAAINRRTNNPSNVMVSNLLKNRNYLFHIPHSVPILTFFVISFSTCERLSTEHDDCLSPSASLDIVSVTNFLISGHTHETRREILRSSCGSFFQT